jgi:PilZ domain-containing protein
MMVLTKKVGHGDDRREHINRRSFPRHSVSSAVDAVDIEGDRRITGRLSDISRKGCYVDTISPFEVGAALTLTIIREKQSIKTRATVVYCQIGMGMGLSFTTTEPDQVLLLLTWMEELGGGKQQGPDSPNIEMQLESAASADPILRGIVVEIIAALRREGILKDWEENVMLQKLSG